MSVPPPARGLTQPSSVNTNEPESSRAATPKRETIPDSSATRPSTSSSVRVVPPRSGVGSP